MKKTIWYLLGTSIIIAAFAMYYIDLNYDRSKYIFNGYSIEMESDIEKYIIIDKPNNTVIKDKWGSQSNVRKLFRIDNFDSLSISYQGQGSVVIPPFILIDESAFDCTFLLAIQQALYTKDTFLSSKYYYEQLNNKNYKSIKHRKKWYWIINLQKDTIYGPLTYEKYAEKRKELAVSSRMKLKSEKNAD